MDEAFALLSNLDIEAVKPEISGTLAGLSIAAAAFLSSVQRTNATQFVHATRAVSLLLLAFQAFLVALVLDLLVSPGISAIFDIVYDMDFSAVIKDTLLVSKGTLAAQGGDTITQGLAFSLGVIYLFRAVRSVRSTLQAGDGVVAEEEQTNLVLHLVPVEIENAKFPEDLARQAKIPTDTMQEMLKDFKRAHKVESTKEEGWKPLRKEKYYRIQEGAVE